MKARGQWWQSRRTKESGCAWTGQSTFGCQALLWLWEEMEINVVYGQN